MIYWCAWNDKEATLTKKDKDGNVISETVYAKNEIVKFGSADPNCSMAFDTNVYEMEKYDTEAELETKVDSLKGAGYYKENK